MVKALSQAEIDRIAADGVRLLKGDRKDPPIVNVENAWVLGEPIPLTYRGATYTVRSLSYRNGLGLQRAERMLHQWANNPAQTVEEVDEQEAELIQTLALFQSLLDPIPTENPFAEASPLEVGELLRFFSMCLMMQNAPSTSVANPSRTSTRLTN